MEIEKLTNRYYPMLAGFTDIDFFSKESMQAWAKKKALPKKSQEILASEEIAQFIYNVEQRYRLRDKQTEEFSRMVRGYFFREVTEEGFAHKVAQLCRIAPDEAMKLLRTINAITPGDSAHKEQSEERVKMSLKKALATYPHIKDQVITAKAIVSKPFLNPLKPTVKNWIMVYEKVLDVTQHDALERGEFVYRTEATRGLSDTDRKKLLLLFKSRDEGSDLLIDPVNMVIDFSGREKEINTVSQKSGDMSSISHKKPLIQQSSHNTIIQPALAHNNNGRYGMDMQPKSVTSHVQAVNDDIKDRKTHIFDGNTTSNDAVMSSDVAAQTKEALQKTTNELEVFMGTMQSRTPAPQVNRQKKPLVQNVALNSALHAEIEKNRQEMQSKNVKKMHGDHVQLGGNIVHENQQMQIHSDTKKLGEQDSNKSQTQASQNTISFSSNHTFPAEQDKKKILQASKNLYNMKPIGHVHHALHQGDSIASKGKKV